MNLFVKFFISILILQGIFISFTPLTAQVLCIDCYRQNERVLPNGTNLILNGGFENGCDDCGYFCPNSFDYSCDISNWVCTGGGYETYATCISSFDLSLVVEGEKAVYFGNAFCEVCTTLQDTSCLVQTGCEIINLPVGYPISYPEYGGTEGLSLEQQVFGTIPGDNYELEFWAGGEEFANTFFTNGLFAVDVGFGKIYLRDPPTPAVGGIGIRYVILFKAVSDSTTIKFTNWGHMHVTATELIIDDIRLIKSTITGDPCSTAIQELDDQEFVRLVPNPFHSITRFELNNIPLRHAQLLIYNSIGNLVNRINVVEPIFEFNRNTLPGGIYYFQFLIQNQVVQTGKFIIQ